MHHRLSLNLIQGGGEVPIGVFQTTTIDHKWLKFDIFRSAFLEMNGTGKETKIDENFEIPFIGNMVRKTSIFEGYCVKKNRKFVEVRGFFVFETRSEDLESEKYFRLNQESQGLIKASVKKTKEESKNQPKGSYRYYHVMTRPLEFFMNSSHSVTQIFYRWTPFKCKDSTRCTHMVNIRSFA